MLSVRPDVDYERRPVLLGIPFDANSSFLRGPAEGPAAVREELSSPSSNGWTETGIDLNAPGIWYDVGDASWTSDESAFGAIQDAITLLVGRGAVPISVGGDHSVTYPILEGFARAGIRPDILHFDAHPDLYDELDGNRHSHASPFARIMESGLASRLVQVGIRTLNAHQREQASRFAVEQIQMREIDRWRGLRFERPLYVTFDMDVLDPAFAPGVSHHEPGGLSTREALAILHSLRVPIVGADVVELNPRRDVVGITAAAAAKITRELMGLVIAMP